MATQYQFINFFGETDAGKELLGGKGFGLNEMVKADLPVPMGFTITTKGYKHYAFGGSLHVLENEVELAMHELEERTGQRLGSGENPLFVSVRSGAAVSMPGMMDTLLNVGCTETSIDALARKTGDPKFAYGTFRRFMESYCKLVNKDVVFEFDRWADRIPFSFLLEYTGGRYLGTAVLESHLTSLAYQKKAGISNVELHCLLNDILNFELFEFAQEPFVNAMKYYCVGTRFKLSGSRVKDEKTEKEGTVKCIVQEADRDYIVVVWDADRDNITDSSPEFIEEISVSDLYNSKRYLSLKPELIREAKKYIDELVTIGQLEADTRRVWSRYTWGGRKAVIPPDPMQQVHAAVLSVFKSWENKRAKEYRQVHDIPDNMGTAVNIQAMVFGNRQGRSGTAVVFSSCPSTGKAGLSGQYLLNAQGEELVSGAQTPAHIGDLADADPEVHGLITDLAATLESSEKQILDIELTWENGQLYVLQRRAAKLTPTARVAYLLRKYDAQELLPVELIQNISLEDITAITKIEKVPETTPSLAQGSSLLSGVITGRVAFTEDEITTLKQRYPNEKIIYCREETTPDDISGVRQADAIVTTRGGSSSHASLVALSMQKICVAGCADSEIKQNGEIYSFTFAEQKSCFTTGDIMTIDGGSGRIYDGRVEAVKGRTSPLIARVQGITQDLLEGKSQLYEFHCLGDLEYLTDKETIPDRAVYNIDFDCLDASGVLSDKLSMPERRRRVERRAREVFDGLKEGGLWPILQSAKLFDAGIEDAGFSATKLRHWYLHAFQEAAKQDGVQTAQNAKQNAKRGANPDVGCKQLEYETRFEPNFGERMFLTTHNLPYRTIPAPDTSRVYILPWAEQESYLKAAQQVIFSG